MGAAQGSFGALTRKVSGRRRHHYHPRLIFSSSGSFEEGAEAVITVIIGGRAFLAGRPSSRPLRSLRNCLSLDEISPTNLLLSLFFDIEMTSILSLLLFCDVNKTSLPSPCCLLACSLLFCPRQISPNQEDFFLLGGPGLGTSLSQDSQSVWETETKSPEPMLHSQAAFSSAALQQSAGGGGERKKTTPSTSFSSSCSSFMSSATSRVHLSLFVPPPQMPC